MEQLPGSARADNRDRAIVENPTKRVLIDIYGLDLG